MFHLLEDMLPIVARWRADKRNQQNATDFWWKTAERTDATMTASRENFRLPLREARMKARQVINESPAGGCATIIENWRQLPDGQIEFSVRRLPVAD
jgi:hypothetical protein